MTYKQYLTNTMTNLAKDPKVFFLGYNVRFGHQFSGTLVNVPRNKLIEMPVAENLIMGMGIGMALEGYRPVILFERMDFLWVCADAIINHLDKARKLGWPSLNIIIRTCVGHDKPLDPGPQHKGDYYLIMKQLLSEIKVTNSWKNVLKYNGPIMIVEWKKDYAKNILRHNHKRGE